MDGMTIYCKEYQSIWDNLDGDSNKKLGVSYENSSSYVLKFLKPKILWHGLYLILYICVYDSCNPQKGKIANILQRYDLSYVGLMMMMTTEELIMYNSTIWLKVHNSNIDLYRSSSYLYIWSR